MSLLVQANFRNVSEWFRLCSLNTTCHERNEYGVYIHGRRVLGERDVYT